DRFFEILDRRIHAVTELRQPVFGELLRQRYSFRCEGMTGVDQALIAFLAWRPELVVLQCKSDLFRQRQPGLQGLTSCASCAPARPQCRFALDSKSGLAGYPGDRGCEPL